MKNFILFTVIASLTFVACKKKDKGNPHYQTLTGNVEFVKIAHGTFQHTTYLTGTTKVVRIADSGTWKDFSSKIHRDDLNNQVEIDFNTHQIMGVVNTEERSNTIKITSIIGHENKDYSSHSNHPRAT